MNIIYLLCILIITLLIIYNLNKSKDNFPIIITYITTNILSFILTFKYITLSNLNINANIITYTLMFTTLYILLEKNTKKEITKLTNLNLIINIFTALLLFIMTYYTQSLNDTISINMTNVFYNNYRILIAYPISIYLSQKLLINTYSKIQNLYNNLFISMVTTYLFTGLIESIIYIIISYYNILNIQTLIKLILSTYMIRIIITVIYSLFLTIINIKKKVKQ